jgi:hypothetical protein
MDGLQAMARRAALRKQMTWTDRLAERALVAIQVLVGEGFRATQPTESSSGPPAECCPSAD